MSISRALQRKLLAQQVLPAESVLGRLGAALAIAHKILVAAYYMLARVCSTVNWVSPTSTSSRRRARQQISTRIPQMDRGGTVQSPGIPSENADSYFHPPFGHTFSDSIVASP